MPTPEGWTAGAEWCASAHGRPLPRAVLNDNSMAEEATKVLDEIEAETPQRLTD